jgi:hypothetical protein
MDHDDWPDWSADGPHPDDADTADLHDGHDQHALDGGLDHLGGDDDLSGHDLGGHHDLPGHEPHDADLDRPDLAGDDDHAAHGHHAAGHGPYPDDDPFGNDDHGDHGADHQPAHDHDAAHDPVHDRGPEPAELDHLPVDHLPVDHVVGADPDIDPHADAGWDDHRFPPPLDLEHVPAPVDGFPWSDPHTLGGGIDDPAHLHAGWGAPPAADLLDYAGLEASGDDDGWQALLGSDDPATSALARWWAPDG